MGNNAASAKAIFKRTLKGINLMTPIIVRYGKRGKYLYELAKSSDDYLAYGVTVLEIVSGKFPHCTVERVRELSLYTRSLPKAENHIDQLKY